MAGNCPFPFSLFSKSYLLVFISLFLYPMIEAKIGGFSTHLIHRDSPKSPSHNPSNSYFERLNKAFHRSFARAEYFKKRISQSRSNHLSDSSSDPIQSHLTPSNGEYLIKVSIGTPPVDNLAIADTGSDLTWTQCQPCTQCFKQDAPLFDPSKTTTYRQVSCDTPLCRVIPDTTYCYLGKKCGYSVSYGDQSYSHGDLSTETFTFESSSGGYISIQNVGFGCGHENGGTFRETASGIVGLGGGALSIIRQLNEPIGGKFSYCLVPTDSNISSKISFGTNAVVSGPGVVSTTLFKQNPDTFYYVNLEGFSVGNTTISYKGFSKLLDSSPDDLLAGNIIIDSGTTLTFVPGEFYQNLESEVIRLTRGTRVPDPGALFDICYKIENNLQIPNIVAHFTGANILLPPNSTFPEVSEGVVCLSVVPESDVAIFGNLLQINYLIGYDLVNKKLSFLPTDCTKNM